MTKVSYVAFGMDNTHALDTDKRAWHCVAGRSDHEPEEETCNILRQCESYEFMALGVEVGS
jgi:hypothetical protein